MAPPIHLGAWSMAMAAFELLLFVLASNYDPSHKAFCSTVIKLLTVNDEDDSYIYTSSEAVVR